jgi:hypothetical protein
VQVVARTQDQIETFVPSVLRDKVKGLRSEEKRLYSKVYALLVE